MVRTKSIKKKSKKAKKEEKNKALVVAGTRKRSIARAVIKPGTGIIRINKKPIELFNTFQRLTLSEPLVIAEQVLKNLNQLDIEVNVKGGGVESQIDATRLALARALVNFTKSQELKRAYLHYDRSLLVADFRRKEQRKPGRSKARAKKQKSYR